MKIRHGFVTNSSSTSFLLVFDSKKPQHRLYRLLGAIPGIGEEIPIAFRGTDAILKHLVTELKDNEEDYIEELKYADKEDTEEDKRWWLKLAGGWYKSHKADLKGKILLVTRYQNRGAVVWLTDFIEDQGGDYLLYKRLSENSIEDVTILPFEEER